MISGDIQAIKGKQGPFSTTLKGLSRHWGEVIVYCTSLNENLIFRPYPNVTLLSFKRSLFSKIFLAQKIGQLCKEHNPNLILSHDYGFVLNGFNSLFVSKLSGIPYISEIFHIEGYPHISSSIDYAYRLIMRLYVLLSKNHVSFYRVMNKQDVYQRLMSWGVLEEKIKNISAIYLDQKIFYDRKAKRINDLVFCGRLVSNKGIFNILEALFAMKQKGKDYKLTMVGNGPLESEVNKFVKDHNLTNNVKHIPWVETPNDLAEIYSQSKILICASTAEGGPRVPIEAMACGAAIITTPVGVMPETIQHKKNGMIYHWEQEQLESMIESLLENKEKRSKMAAEGLITAKSFDVDATLKKYALSSQEAALSLTK